MEEPGDDNQPPKKGLVIITLPPPENPSLGKTITFYPFHPQIHRNPQIPQTHQPQNAPQTYNLRFSFQSFRLGTKYRVLGLLGIVLFASMLLLYSFYDEGLRELMDDEEENGRETFVLPLYPKLRGSEVGLKGDVELKLGRFVGDEVYGVSKVGSASIGIDSSASVLPVRGNVYPEGLYFTSLLVGNPPRPYFLDMDTGSDLTWIQCDAPCTSCAKGPHQLYKPSRSKIVSPKDLLCTEIQRNLKTTYCDSCHQCDYQIEYADHSSSIGVLAKDKLTLLVSNGSLAKLDTVFGCAYDQQGSLLNSLVKTDGILGLSKSKVSLPSQLASQGIINNVFGHCLSTYASGGGYMFLGDELVPDESMAWVPMLMTRLTNSYTAEIVSVSYKSRQMRIDGPDGMHRWVLFDSGSSYTYFPQEAYSDLLVLLEDVSVGGLTREASDPTLPLCWRADFPKTGNICLGILDGSEVLSGSCIILGDISMRGHLIVYDNMKERIGWVKSDCVPPTRFKQLPPVSATELSV
ncbi:Aspartyl protease APCB1-like protein [Drosera capensis]